MGDEFWYFGSFSAAQLAAGVLGGFCLLLVVLLAVVWGRIGIACTAVYVALLVGVFVSVKSAGLVAVIAVSGAVLVIASMWAGRAGRRRKSKVKAVDVKEPCPLCGQ